jgi:hypothetical protein
MKSFLCTRDDVVESESYEVIAVLQRLNYPSQGEKVKLEGFIPASSNIVNTEGSNP